jgi:hypothetical protein
MAIAEIVELVGHSIEGLAGWRYLLSPSFRQRTNERWRKQSRLETTVEVLLFGVSFIFVTLIIGGILWLLLT